MRLPAHVLLAAFVTTTCGGAATAPSDPARDAPQVAGTYTGPTTDYSISPPVQVPTWNVRFLRAGANNWLFRTCTGTVTIEQAGSNFTGSFSQGQTCPAIEGRLINGIVRPDASVRFSLVGPASDPLAWTGFANCTSIQSGVLEFAGTVNGPLLDAELSQGVFIQCPNEGTVSVYVHVRGAR